MHCNLILKPVWTSNIVAMARWSSHMNTILKYHKNNAMLARQPNSCEQPFITHSKHLLRHQSKYMHAHGITYEYVTYKAHHCTTLSATMAMRNIQSSWKWILSVFWYIHYGSCLLKTRALSYRNCSNIIKTKHIRNCNISQMSKSLF
jgi:hypothetical protein